LVLARTCLYKYSSVSNRRGGRNRRRGAHISKFSIIGGVGIEGGVRTVLWDNLHVIDTIYLWLNGNSSCNYHNFVDSHRAEKWVRCVACQPDDNSINAGQARGQICSGYRNEDRETNRVKSSRKEQFRLIPMSALVMKILRRIFNFFTGASIWYTKVVFHFHLLKKKLENFYTKIKVFILEIKITKTNSFFYLFILINFYYENTLYFNF